MIALAALTVSPAAAIVREKEIATIEQLMITPIRTGELFLAKAVPPLPMGLLSVFPASRSSGGSACNCAERRRLR
jgi:ABC-2 type transport system permease protein